MSCIVSTGSIHGPEICRDGAPVVFQRMCKVVSAILTTHRRRLRGRCHVMVQVMQSLLRLLFVPDPRVRQQKSGRVRSRPPWLCDKGTALGVTEAAAYCRLLTSWCDPSVSAVASTSHRSQQALTPATDKARRLVGQHAPYLLLEYAQCQLHSRLLPNVKHALLPGLYAIFEVTSPETLRMINASMDSSSRAIFKALAEEYRRSGRGERT